MREIKFRAWDIKRKEMVDCISVGFWTEVTPEYNDDEGNYTYALQSELYSDGSGEIECYLMQYTGLKDKNDLTDIYEGDIIDIKGNKKGNIYENHKGKTDLVIQGFGTKDWCATYKKALDRGCKNSK